jgi:hypothetical protein
MAEKKADRYMWILMSKKRLMGSSYYRLGEVARRSTATAPRVDHLGLLIVNFVLVGVFQPVTWWGRLV